ncbi:MAG: tryptophan--tRNA ligase [Candidatus Schekmanbacteria bacterium]|nr:tryptophan--tRNA ligase [Candidatus Schekmanbacteria bacterium]
MDKTKARVLSGIQPSGYAHLGNFFGAFVNWARLQHECDCLYCIVDLHALTSVTDSQKLRDMSRSMALDILACGVDPERATLFIQSSVPEHTELLWIFCTLTGFGDLSRMTQFKAKAEQGLPVTAALFAYPVLQAADILLYKAAKVPVGEDQLQHLELTRRIARSFNYTYGELFPEVEPILSEATRILSLADPTQKMSKSLGERHVIGVFEDEKSIRMKIRSAVTDIGLDEVKGSAQKSPGVQNLFVILKMVGAHEAVTQFEAAYAAGKLMYKDLKAEVADRLMTFLRPYRERREELAAVPGRVEAILAAGNARARQIATETLREVRDRIGLLSV